MPEQITKPISINPARLCQALARIGYEPQIALMDIIDNAVTAIASTIHISLFLAPGKTLRNRNSVKKYQVVDDGIGMSDDEIIAAFALGANGNYEKHSLSKYGMGLKSAGLSLGTRIHIISKKAGKLSSRQTFDVEEIAKANSFVIQVTPLQGADEAYYSQLLPKTSGTIIEIDGCENINHQSPNTTVRKLEETMGVVYERFISDENKPVTIGIRVCAGDNPAFKLIEPLDILFKEQAKPWDIESYDYASPYLVLDEDWKPDLGDGKLIPPIKLSAVVFPRDSLGKGESPLPPDEKKKVNGYKVSRENAGCFVYRNNRLIRWGDSLGIFTKDEYNIRVRMDLTEDHDDVLHVDVTKQRLEIDDELHARLKRILGEPKDSAKLVMKKCTEFLKKPVGQEGARFSDLSTNVPEDDPDDMATGEPPEEVLQRQYNQAKEAEEIKASADENLNSSSTIELNTFAKIRYTSQVDYQHLWTPYRDAKDGVFVCINTVHPFYTEFMKELADNSPERILLEALIFAAGVGQINTIGNLYDVEAEIIKTVFNRFHSNCGTYLANFTTENINLNNE